ncbi:MAG: hypothetical protein ACRCWJ_11205 [Casimicrobium sp.]
MQQQNNRPDFNRTSEQLRREIQQNIETVYRNLVETQSNSNGQSRTMWSVIAIVVVFAAQVVWQQVVTPPKQPASSQVTTQVGGDPTKTDQRLIANQLQRIEEQTSAIASKKSQVAPNLPIDANLSTINAAITDLRVILQSPQTETRR